jgi:predicted nucleic acid-binding protein
MMLDTTAWIDFLSPGDRPLGNSVRSLIAADRAVICGAVVAELLRGVKGARELRQLRSLLDAIPRLETTEQDWVDAGNLLMGLREKGVTLPRTDALIATIAKRNGIAVLTADAHFRHLGAPILEPPDYH